MVRILILWPAIYFVVAGQDIGQFFNPPIAVIQQAGFNSNPIWILGETQLIQWTTVYSNYSIALWQQALGEPSAQQGPAIFQTEKGAVTEFNWIVQSFQFDLRRSNVFFLWLIAPGEKLSTTSHYFNISVAESNLGSSTLQPSFSASPISSAVDTKTASVLTPPTSPALETKETSKHSSGLSVGGEVALGLGLAIGLFVITAAGIFITLRGQKRRASAKQEQYTSRPHPETQWRDEAPPLPPKYPVEIGDEYGMPAELS